MSKILKFGIGLLIIICIALIAINLPFFQKITNISFAADFSADGHDPALQKAVEDALAAASGSWAEYDYQIDHVQYQDDEQMAIVWLAAFDVETKELIGREPELALAEASNGGWEVLLGDDPKFGAAFKNFQYAEKNILDGDLLDEEPAPKSTKVFGGYYLPWAANLEKRLTWSVAHTSCYPIYYCTHAFDFADGTMFPLVAAKGGTVYHWRDTCANGDSSCTNSITIEDRSTTPWTYQIYLHIAQGSVPDHLKKVGTPVLQGQYIADVDDTGYSTGHHVHFMVVSEETKYISGNGYVWGVAEDITFRDVSINWDEETQGGRPRLAYEAETYGGEGQTYYVSGNLPAHPPTGELTEPENKQYLTEPTLIVKGYGEDDIEVVKMELLVNYAGEWVKIGEELTDNPFSTEIDLCESGIPDGPFKLALRAWDYEGNPSVPLSVKSLVKDAICEEGAEDPEIVLVHPDSGGALPRNGMVTAETQDIDPENVVFMVEFWFHSDDWENGDWVLLGEDLDGEDGWSAPITTTQLQEGNNYAVLAMARDLAENVAVTVNFQAVVDLTRPWININPLPHPHAEETFVLEWEAGDSLSGVDHYKVAMRVNNGSWRTLASSIPVDTTTIEVPAEEGNFYEFRVIAYDKSQNYMSDRVMTATLNYPGTLIFPLFIE